MLIECIGCDFHFQRLGRASTTCYFSLFVLYLFLEKEALGQLMLKMTGLGDKCQEPRQRTEERKRKSSWMQNRQNLEGDCIQWVQIKLCFNFPFCRLSKSRSHHLSWLRKPFIILVAVSRSTSRSLHMVFGYRGPNRA